MGEICLYKFAVEFWNQDTKTDIRIRHVILYYIELQQNLKIKGTSKTKIRRFYVFLGFDDDCRDLYSSYECWI
jgi:hypothetical protein